MVISFLSDNKLIIFEEGAMKTLIWTTKVSRLANNELQRIGSQIKMIRSLERKQQNLQTLVRDTDHWEDRNRDYCLWG